ncbi:MAG: hypothetical protein K2M73_10665 [Lachnospiraceae bacterium]|nr:hypothetical protein [Lachnospiraceae bacterium]
MKKGLTPYENMMIEQLKFEGKQPIINKKGHLCFTQRHPILCSKEMIPAYISLVSIVISITAIILKLC